MVEGPVLVADALRAGTEITDVFVSAELADDSRQVVRAAEATGAVVREVAHTTLTRTLDTVTSPGVAAVATWADPGLDAAADAVAAGGLVLVLVDVADPGNAGTLLRVADAAGAPAVVLCGTSVDPTNPKCVRASAGALFHVATTRVDDPVAVLTELRGAGGHAVGATARGGVAYDQADLTGGVALVLGGEAHGLPLEIVGRLDVTASIPMAGRAESLNVAMAGAVLAMESHRQRRQSIGETPA